MLLHKGERYSLGYGIHTGFYDSQDFAVFDIFWKLLDTQREKGNGKKMLLYFLKRFHNYSSHHQLSTDFFITTDTKQMNLSKAEMRANVTHLIRVQQKQLCEC